MGMYANVELLEPMNCFRCSSTPDDNVGSNLRDRIIKSGEHSLRVLIINDGRGGIKNFQTKDIEPELLGPPYRFPGYIPNESYGGGEISLTEVCNECETMWIGKLHAEPHKADGICITQSLDLTTQDKGIEIDDLSFKLALWQSNSSLYTFSSPKDRVISIVPDIETAVRLYKQKSLDAILQSENAIGILRSIRVARVPTDELLRFLDEELQYVEQRRENYQNELAKAVFGYNIQEERATLSKSALRAALVILYNYDRRKAIELLDVSGLEPKNFELDLKVGRWFFIPSEQMTDKDRFVSSAGYLGGPNMFLHRLKEQKS